MDGQHLRALQDLHSLCHLGVSGRELPDDFDIPDLLGVPIPYSPLALLHEDDLCRAMVNASPRATSGNERSWSQLDPNAKRPSSGIPGRETEAMSTSQPSRMFSETPGESNRIHYRRRRLAIVDA
jgi:hypothetical protein